MRRALAAVVAICACAGCTPPSYPGARGGALDPSAYVSQSCPDISGKYEGRGSLVEGDAVARRAQRSLRIDYAFPFKDDSHAQEVLTAENARYPKLAIVTWSERIAAIKLEFTTGQPVEYISSMTDKGRFVCTGPSGKIVWGGASSGARSEFGPNSTDTTASLYLDESGNLMAEDHTQVHMSMLFGAVPTGTAQHYSIYRFKRLPE